MPSIAKENFVFLQVNKLNIAMILQQIKRISFVVVIILILMGALVSWMTFTPICKNAEATYIYIDSDDDIDSIYTKINAHARPMQMAGFKMLTCITGYGEIVKTGKFEMGNGLSTLDVLRNLRNKHQVPVRLVVPSVRTLERLVAKLDNWIEPDSAALITYLRNDSICQTYGYTRETMSCLFIPNTYEVFWDITPEQLVKRMKKESDRFWTKERKEKAKTQGLTPNEAITLASIVDQETANNGEKPAIAGMYLNRLRKGMLLQADPTVKFALQQFALRRILHEHLMVDSPYNTYRYKGLPPGPIAIPAISSIEAVLNAEQNDYLYMCAKEDFSGTHNFAATYGEHLRNARKYTQALDKRGIK